MTDLATRPAADGDSAAADDATTTVLPEVPAETPPTYEWAPAEPAPRKRRTGLWIGIPAVATVVALVAASLVLIAPGTSVAGVQVGGMTAGAAADAVGTRLATTTVVIDTVDGPVSVTGADLGATVDAGGRADSAFSDHPMWNVSQWYPAADTAPITIDAERATAVLRAAAPDMYVDPIDAAVVYGDGAYVVEPAVAGEGLDLDVVAAALQSAFDAGETSVALEGTTVPVEAAATTDEATATADSLNGVLESAGFYVGDERTVPVDADTVASWLTVDAVDGSFAVSADEAAIQQVVDGIAAEVEREAVDATVITNSAGTVLREETAGVTGRAIENTDGIAAAYAEQLSAGDGAYVLPVVETDFETTSLYRHIDVNLSTQQVTMYENGAVTASFATSSGLPDTLTPTGNFTVFAHVPIQDMGCYEGAEYCTEDVPWVVYFAPDIGFHGAYWHNNFGEQMSHGCLNLPVSTAKFLYDWTPTGTEVSVHY